MPVRGSRGDSSVPVIPLSPPPLVRDEESRSESTTVHMICGMSYAVNGSSSFLFWLQRIHKCDKQFQWFVSCGLSFSYFYLTLLSKYTEEKH